jgi:hypothetical protein
VTRRELLLLAITALTVAAAIVLAVTGAFTRVEVVEVAPPGCRDVVRIGDDAFEAVYRMAQEDNVLKPAWFFRDMRGLLGEWREAKDGCRSGPLSAP